MKSGRRLFGARIFRPKWILLLSITFGLVSYLAILFYERNLYRKEVAISTCLHFTFLNEVKFSNLEGNIAFEQFRRQLIDAQPLLERISWEISEELHNGRTPTGRIYRSTLNGLDNLDRTMQKIIRPGPLDPFAPDYGFSNWLQ